MSKCNNSGEWSSHDIDISPKQLIIYLVICVENLEVV